MIKDASLTLHACPNFAIQQDIYVIDLPPYFAICLSRDFTAKIGGYLLSDWSHMLFRTRYGTEVTIKSELLARNHIEPYVPSALNANFLAFDEEEHDIPAEARTQLDDIPNILLDEWALSQTYENHFYDLKNADLRTYVIHE